MRSHGRVSYLDQIASRTVAAPGALRPPSMFGFLSREAPLHARETEDDKIDSEPPARQLTVHVEVQKPRSRGMHGHSNVVASLVTVLNV